jgi:restriction system protein
MGTIPSWSQFNVPVLQVMADGAIRPLRDVRAATGTLVGLTDDQLADRFAASGELVASNRIDWAVNTLAQAGALSRPERAQYQISDHGCRLLASHPDGIIERDLKSTPGDSSNHSVNVLNQDAVLSPDPVEQIEQGIARIHADIAADLLTRLHDQAPEFFEQAVLDLLMGMGYGGAEGQATRTQLSNDGGIDGFIDQDALGLSRIYVQAKRYALNTSVQRPEIQGFVGAMNGQSGPGVFITTGRFSAGAQQYAKSVPTRIVLIDGQRLASLMIRYGVGVQVRRTVALVEIDEDFFE